MGLRLDPGTDETSSLVLLNDKSSGGSAHQQKHETACCPGPRLCQRGTNMWDERGGCSLASYLHSFPCVGSERNQQTQENKHEESGQAGESQAGNDFLPFPPTKFQSNRWVSSTGAGVFLLVLQIFLQLWKQRFLQEEVDIRALTETGAKSTHKNAMTEEPEQGSAHTPSLQLRDEKRAADGRKGEKEGWQRCCLTERFAAHPRSFRCMEE